MTAMTSPIDPIRSTRPVARSPRHEADDAAASETEPTFGLQVVAAIAPTPPPSTKAEAAFAAQMIAGPQRRGLRGGATTLETAKAAYMGAEWSGGSDRRTRRGGVTKTEI